MRGTGRLARTSARRTMLGMAALVLVGMALGPPAVDAASASKQDVRVTNTTEEAVPTAQQGPIGLEPGTTVGATQSGPWNVSIGDLPAVQLDPTANGVQILNGPSNPVHVVSEDGVGRELFQRYFIMGVRGGQRCESASLSLVPDGTRLVITSINAHMYPITGVGVRTWVQAHRTDGSFANVHVPYEKQDYHDDVNDRDDYVGAVETTLVHDNAFPFFVTICMSQPAPGDSNSSLGVFQGTLTGYTVPLES